MDRELINWIKEEKEKARVFIKEKVEVHYHMGVLDELIYLQMEIDSERRDKGLSPIWKQDK